MSTHNICFCGEIRKIFTRYSLLSRTMDCTGQSWPFLLAYAVKFLFPRHGPSSRYSRRDKVNKKVKYVDYAGFQINYFR